MNEEKELDEEALEGVTGGKVTFDKPVYDPEELPNTGPAGKVQCPVGANLLKGE